MKRPSLELTQPGWAMALAVMVLVTIGVASIYVTDTHYVRGHDGPANAAKQCLRVLVSLVLSMAILRIGYQRLSRHAYALFFGTLLLLVPLLVARLLHTDFGGLTAPRNGAYRWLHLPGFPVQPSEFLKTAFCLALAWYLSRVRCVPDAPYRRLGGLLIPVSVSTIPLGLILFQPDLGTALLLVPVLLVMLFMAGAKMRHLLFIVSIGLAGVPVAWGQIKGYQRDRVTAVLLQSEKLRRAVIDHPETYRFLVGRRQAIEWAASSGYQLVHSKNAIGSGGVLGQGQAGVYVRSALLPDRHNDFVFSIIAHQWGLIGCLLVLICNVVIVLAGVRIASATMDPFGQLLAVGIVALIATQVIINVGMAIGLMPTTGTTLPFVSYGGSSLLSHFMGLALLISVSQNRPFLLATRPFEFKRRVPKAAHLVEEVT